tara:strand:+ start:526 stop:813 length:288 start_codon:yes stop_codon:yes gene_type:complete
MTHTDLVIERIRQYGALLVIASQYGDWSRTPDEAKRLLVLAEAEEVLDGLAHIVGESYTREDIDNATDIARVQGQIGECGWASSRGDTLSSPTKL